MPTTPRPSEETPAGLPGASLARWPDDMRGVSDALVAIFEAKSTGADGRIRVEDLLSAAAAACGEACIAAAGEFDPEDHAFTPGAAVMSDRINAILADNARDWPAAGQSVFGIIRTGAIASGYSATDFPPIGEPFKFLAASLGGGGTGDDPAATWGFVALSVPDANRPRVQPIRQSFELRAPVRDLLLDRGVPRSEWPAACALALVVELAHVREAIDHRVAVRIVLETVNGMAKMAPMTERHMREAAG